MEVVVTEQYLTDNPECEAKVGDTIQVPMEVEKLEDEPEESPEEAPKKKKGRPKKADVVETPEDEPEVTPETLEDDDPAEDITDDVLPQLTINKHSTRLELEQAALLLEIDEKKIMRTPDAAALFKLVKNTYTNKQRDLAIVEENEGEGQRFLKNIMLNGKVYKAGFRYELGKLEDEFREKGFIE